jgi:outer membrane protein TolC
MKRFIVITAILLTVAGCTVHPDGERQERRSAAAAGVPFQERAADRHLPLLSPDASPDELVDYALLASPELEQHYWEWVSAIEQIPQDGTQPTNLVVYAGVPLNRGSAAFNGSTITVANDPMADIVWPSKLSAAAARALENARAAGYRFQQAKLDLRQRVLDAYDDYALAAEQLRLDGAELTLLNTAAAMADAGIEPGRTTQSASLRAHTDADLAANGLRQQEARLPALRATLNALLGREPSAPLPPPAKLPVARPTPYTTENAMRLVNAGTLTLAALDAEGRGRAEGKRLAELQFLPDFSLSGGTDVSGIAQTLTGMITAPILRYQSINAAIAQAEANIRTTDGMRQQVKLDLKSRVVTDLVSIADADRQLLLLEHTLLPRVREATEATRAGYESGDASFTDLLDAQRSGIALERLAAQLRVSRDRQAVDIETSLGRRADRPRPDGE